MQIKLRKWEKNHSAVSVDYGPLSFSLRMGEKWTRYGDNKTWPEWEVFPTTAWNYGLVLNERNPAKSFEIVQQPGRMPAQPVHPRQCAHDDSC